jgi:hypothetical protein
VLLSSDALQQGEDAGSATHSFGTTALAFGAVKTYELSKMPAAGGWSIMLLRATQPLASCPLAAALPTRPASHSHTTTGVRASELIRPAKHCDGLPPMSSRLKPPASIGSQMLGSTRAILLLNSKSEFRDTSAEKLADSSVRRLKERDL